MGKLVVFEGIDGSGKSTQFARMCARLSDGDVPFRRLNFPRYQEQSSALIRLYLDGAFGEDPGAVNPYAASTFYSADRYASYVQDWRGYYQNGGLLLLDRYTTSNALHQASKLPPDKRPDFFGWLYDFEFGLMELPRPDIVLYMDLPIDEALARIKKRQAATGLSVDIHERDAQYLKACWECGAEAADFYGWRRIACFDGQRARSEEELHEEIYHVIADGVIL